MRTLAFGITLAVIAGCGVAFAEQPGQSAQGHPGSGGPGAAPVTKAQAQEMAGRMFERMDANRDGKVDASDREARRTARRQAMFEKIDANRDGQVSREEFMGFKPEGRMGHNNGMGGPGMGGHDRQGAMGGHAGRGGEGHHMGRRGHGKGMGHMGGMMRTADANNDGAISRDEFMAAHARHFESTDTNHDGTVTPEERHAAHGAMRQRMHGGAGGHGGHGGPGSPGTATPPPAGN